jgi:hypothetical protein
MSLTPLNPDEKVPSGLSPAETRRARQREDARRAILDATEALLLEAGGEAFGVRVAALRLHRADHLPLLRRQGRADRRCSGASRPYSPRCGRSTGRRPLENLRGMLRISALRRRNPTFYRTPGHRPRRPRALAGVEAAVEFMMRPWEELHAAGRLGVEPEAASQSLWD